MNEISTLKRQIFLFGILTAAVCEVISLILLGPEAKFAYGLVLGTCIAIVNFNLLAFTLNRVLVTGNKWMATIGYMVRMLIYGYAFYICVKISLTAGIACLIGFFTLKVPMYYFHVVRYKLDKNRKVRPEVQRQFEEEDRLADNDDFDREEE